MIANPAADYLIKGYFETLRSSSTLSHPYLSINDVTAIGGGGQGFWDDNIRSLVMRSVTMGKGG